MPDIDLEPRKKRLPLSHPDDTRLPMIMFFVMLAALGLIFWYRADANAEMLFLGTAVFAFVAGLQFAMWVKDRS